MRKAPLSFLVPPCLRVDCKFVSEPPRESFWIFSDSCLVSHACSDENMFPLFPDLFCNSFGALKLQRAEEPSRLTKTSKAKSRKRLRTTAYGGRGTASSGLRKWMKTESHRRQCALWSAIKNYNFGACAWPPVFMRCCLWQLTSRANRLLLLWMHHRLRIGWRQRKLSHPTTATDNPAQLHKWSGISWLSRVCHQALHASIWVYKDFD